VSFECKEHFSFFLVFVTIYSYTGGIHSDNSDSVHTVHQFHHPIICPTIPSTPHWKQLQEVSLFYFMQVYELHQPYILPLISFIPLPFVTPHTHTVPVLQSCFSWLIFELIFKGVSQCLPAVGILYFGSVNPFHYSPLPLYLPLPIFQQLSIHSLIFSTFTVVMLYNITDTASFSFPSPLSP
jgi:hypothetical protein